MKYRKLRIAWSIAWGVACLLLIILWVRSRDRFDLLIQHVTPTTGFTVVSARERILLSVGGLGKELRSDFASMPHERLHDVETFAKGWGFETQVYRSPNPLGVSIKIPHWFPTFFFPMLAAFPWLRWRFSLRTLLIAMTLVAVGLVLVVYALSN